MEHDFDNRVCGYAGSSVNLGGCRLVLPPGPKPKQTSVPSPACDVFLVGPRHWQVIALHLEEEPAMSHSIESKSFTVHHSSTRGNRRGYHQFLAWRKIVLTMLSTYQIDHGETVVGTEISHYNNDVHLNE